MTTHDWVAMALAVFSAIVVPAVGMAFLAKMRAMQADFEESIREMEDRVLNFIRRHEQDGFAHPNLEAIRLLVTKLDAIEKSISLLALMIEKHIAREGT